MRIAGEGLDVRVSFDPDHEDMVAEIYFGGRCLALVSQDDGRERSRIEFYPSADGVSWKLPLAEVEAAIAYAKKRLRELRPTRLEAAVSG